MANFFKDWKNKFNRHAILADLFKKIKIKKGKPYCFQELPLHKENPSFNTGN